MAECNRTSSRYIQALHARRHANVYVPRACCSHCRVDALAFVAQHQHVAGCLLSPCIAVSSRNDLARTQLQAWPRGCQSPHLCTCVMPSCQLVNKRRGRGSPGVLRPQAQPCRAACYFGAVWRCAVQVCEHALHAKCSSCAHDTAHIVWVLDAVAGQQHARAGSECRRVWQRQGQGHPVASSSILHASSAPECRCTSLQYRQAGSWGLCATVSHYSQWSGQAQRGLASPGKALSDCTGARQHCQASFIRRAGSFH